MEQPSRARPEESSRKDHGDRFLANHSRNRRRLHRVQVLRKVRRSNGGGKNGLRLIHIKLGSTESDTGTLPDLVSGRMLKQGGIA
jgi:hypothetical protein